MTGSDITGPLEVWGKERIREGGGLEGGSECDEVEVECTVEDREGDEDEEEEWFVEDC